MATSSQPVGDASEVLERVSDAVFALDTEWRFTYLNSRAEAVLERSDDELIGTSIWDAFPEAVDTVFEEQYHRAMNRQEPVTFETRYEPLEAWFEVRAHPSETGLSVYFHDVTEAREEGHQNVAYETVLDEMTDGVWVIDDDGTLLYVNQPIARQMGVPREQLIGEAYTDRLPQIIPDSVAAQEYRSLVTELISGERDESHNEFAIRIAGELLELEVTMRASQLGKDRRGAVMVARDVTERNARQRELEEKTNRLEAILDTVQVGIFLKDTDGRYVVANQWARDLMGFDSSTEVAGLTDHDVFPEELAERIAVWDRELLESGQPNEVEAEVPTPAGPKILHSVGSPIRDDSGEIRGICSVATDVTEAREREHRLEVTNEKLRILNRIVRHDIRNDMNVAIGWSRELEDHLDDEGRRILDRIQSTHKHVDDLTEVVRDFVEVVGGDGTLALEPTALGTHLQQELDKRRELYPSAEFVVHGEIPSVTVAANELLSSVFRNILNNAVQHNDKDEPTVDVDVELVDERVLVCIADDGPGIQDDLKERVFGRSDAGVDDPASGIGLYLVDRLIEEYDGSVWVEDNDPTGSVFVVQLPHQTP